MSIERYRGFIDDWGAFTRALSTPEPETLRVNRRRTDAHTLVRRLARKGFELVPAEGVDDVLTVERGPCPLSATVEHWLGDFYIQRTSTCVAAPALAPLLGERVLDLCAAPGGKAGHLADLIGPAGCVVANEVNELRARGLLGNIYRMGHANFAVTVGDGRALPESSTFDRVLADVPCSGEGTARRKGGRIRSAPASFARHLAGKQRGLLAKAIRLVRPGGTVLYVTCTFAPEENEAVVADALAGEPVEVVPLSLGVPSAPGLTEFDGVSYGSELAGTARVYPHHLDSGGLYMAKLVKLGNEEARGWGPVDPGGRAESERELAGLAEAEMTGRFGVAAPVLEKMRWRERGGRLWLHSLREWPSWLGDEAASGVHGSHPDGVRLAAIGFRAMEFDSRGRPRPTNDLLRGLDREITERIVDTDLDGLRTLLAGESLPLAPAHALGPHALRVGGDVMGRVAATRQGLRSEISRVRARELLRVGRFRERVNRTRS